MAVYKVAVNICGILRVEADNPVDAERLALSATPSMDEIELLYPNVVAEVVGPSSGSTDLHNLHLAEGTKVH